MKRRPNFSAVEMDALIDGVADSRAIVANACPIRVSKSVKECEWQTITARVNAVSTLHRTVGEVRKKWKNLRMVTKAKKEALVSEFVQLCRQTAGVGDASAATAALKQLTPVECRVMEILESNAAAADNDDADTATAGGAQDLRAASSIAEEDLLDNDTTGATAAAAIIVVGDMADSSYDQHPVVVDSLDFCEEDDDAEDDEDSWSTGGDRAGGQLVIDRSEILSAARERALRFQSRPLPLPPQQPPSCQLPAAKPSILSVVEALQRRLVADAEVATSTQTVGSNGSNSIYASGASAANAPDSADSGAGAPVAADSADVVERRLLRLEERRLQLEREKVVAMREIVANLREIAVAMRGGGCCQRCLRHHHHHDDDRHHRGDASPRQPPSNTSDNVREAASQTSTSSLAELV